MVCVAPSCFLTFALNKVINCYHYYYVIGLLFKNRWSTPNKLFTVASHSLILCVVQAVQAGAGTGSDVVEDPLGGVGRRRVAEEGEEEGKEEALRRLLPRVGPAVALELARQREQRQGEQLHRVGEHQHARTIHAHTVSRTCRRRRTSSFVPSGLQKPCAAALGEWARV